MGGLPVDCALGSAQPTTRLMSEGAAFHAKVETLPVSPTVTSRTLRWAAPRMVLATSSASYSGGMTLPRSPMWLRPCSEIGVEMPEGLITLTRTGAPSFSSSMRSTSE